MTDSKKYRIINAGDRSIIGKVGTLVKYTEWGGLILSIEVGRIRKETITVTLSMGDVEEIGA